MPQHKNKVCALAHAITNQPLRQVLYAIGLQLDEITSKLENLEDEIEKLKKDKEEDEE